MLYTKYNCKNTKCKFRVCIFVIFLQNTEKYIFEMDF